MFPVNVQVPGAAFGEAGGMASSKLSHTVSAGQIKKIKKIEEPIHPMTNKQVHNFFITLKTKNKDNRSIFCILQ